MFDPSYHDTSRREPSFYLARVLGPTMSVLVVLLVLFASIRHQLLYELRPTILHLGIAHIRAVFDLALFGEPDTITVFSAGHKAYPITRFAIANASLFEECWQAILWRIEVGIVVAVALVLGPGAAWLVLLIALDPGPDPVPSPVTKRAPQDVSSMPGWLQPRTQDEPPTLGHLAFEADELHAPESDAPVAVVDIRRPPKSEIEVPSEAPESAAISTTAKPVSAPPIEPGQVRKRPRPEA